MKSKSDYQTLEDSLIGRTTGPVCEKCGKRHYAHRACWWAATTDDDKPKTESK